MRGITEQKIKQDHLICIGANIRRIRLERGLGQTKLATNIQLMGTDITREALVKLERGTQHIQASQLQAIRDALGTSYDELLRESTPVS